MRVIILSAGRGERLMPLTKDRPKSLIDLGGGHTILSRQLDAISKCGVSDVTIVAGYLAEQLEQRALEHGRGLGLAVEIQFNPFSWCSNNLISLWFTKKRIEEGEQIVIVNGDDLFRSRVLSSLLDVDQERGIAAVVSRKEFYDAEDMKVVVKDQTIVRISKQIPVGEAHAESIGMIRLFGNEACRRVAAQLEHMVRQDRCRDLFWLECFNELIDQGNPVYPHEVADSDWVEMDVHPDLTEIVRRVQSTAHEIQEE